MESNIISSERKLWGATVSSAPPEVEFDNVMNSTSPKGMAELTGKIVCTCSLYVTH